MTKEQGMKKIYLKEGIRVIAENGDIYEVEDGDYTIIDNQIRNGPILNIDIVKSIYDDDKREKILDLIDEYGENYIINQLITGMNIELEHTDDNYESLQIAVDHVTEIPDYYTRLIAMEKEALTEASNRLTYEEAKSLVNKKVEVPIQTSSGAIQTKKLVIVYDEKNNWLYGKVDLTRGGVNSGGRYTTYTYKEDLGLFVIDKY